MLRTELLRCVGPTRATRPHRTATFLESLPGPYPAEGAGPSRCATDRRASEFLGDPRKRSSRSDWFSDSQAAAVGDTISVCVEWPRETTSCRPAKNMKR